MNERCRKCMRDKQLSRAERLETKEKQDEYMRGVDKIIEQYGYDNCGPVTAFYLSLYEKEKTGEITSYKELKHKYNMLLLKKEEEIEREIKKSPEPLSECIKYVCAGNYIDFSAVENVNENMLLSLMEKAGQEKINEKEYEYFKRDMKKAESLVYLTDNCGEIILDKIFIKQIKKDFPTIKITVILRGSPVLNDATTEDAEETGLTEIACCMGNGTAVAGTDIKKISREAKEKLLSADVIISKGQGNFESLYGEGLNPYYMLLCKCDLFSERFKVKKFTSVFGKEERLLH